MEHSTSHTDGPEAQGPQAPQESGSRRPEAGHQLFSWIRSTGIVRPDNGWAGGVMAALAFRLGWDAALVRGLGVIALILFFSPAALLYGLAWILVPNPRGEIHLQEAIRGNWTAGVFGGGLLAVVGGINVFTPVSLAGPFAVLLNLAVLGAVLWVVWALVRRHHREKSRDAHGAPRSGTQDPEAPRPDGQGGTSGKARAGNSSSTKDERPGASRTDGRPAWYPTESADGAGHPTGSASPQSQQPGPASQHPAPTAKVAAPPKRAEQRRRYLLTVGLVLLAIPALLGAMWLAAEFGATLFAGLLVGLAGVVVALAVWHMIAAARGRKGRGGLLTTAVVLMLVVFAAHGSSGTGGSNHVFGNYTTSETQVATGFADTTVDLRNLDFDEQDALDLGGAGPDQLPDMDGHFSRTAEINNAFGNTTVILPDDIYWQMEPGNFMGNVEVRTQEVQESDSGIGATTQAYGPEQAVGSVKLHLGNAFGNVVIYDDTTYQREE